MQSITNIATVHHGGNTDALIIANKTKKILIVIGWEAGAHTHT
jgi:hypothetical protein